MKRDELKAYIKSIKMSKKKDVGQRWFERCMEARTENIKLKRALWLARAERAHLKVLEYWPDYCHNAHCRIAEQKWENELRHQKWKRCLAMARIAQDDWHLHNSFYAMGKMDFEQKKCERYERHRLKWLAIADKFKEA